MRPGLIVTVVWPKTNSGSNPLISNSASPHLITDTQIFSWAWSPNSGLGTPQTKKLFFQFEMHSMEPSFSSSSSSSIYAWGPLIYFSTLKKHKLSWSPMLATKKIQLYHYNIKESFSWIKPTQVIHFVDPHTFLQWGLTILWRDKTYLVIMLGPSSQK